MFNSSKITGLSNQKYESDACGVGFVAQFKGIKSHQHVLDALTILESMEHRGACGCEENTGDGAGILIEIPHEFFFDECLKNNIYLPSKQQYGVGFIFFPKEENLKAVCKSILERTIAKLGLKTIYYRKVPTSNTELGKSAISVEPIMEQIFIECPVEIKDPIEFERKLFVLRNYVSHIIQNTVKLDTVGFYIASLSCQTIVYKGQLTSKQLRNYFPDLTDERVVSSFGLVHSRFATNTVPSWKLAQPFRYIAHNGEINTVQGNINWFHSNEISFSSPYFTDEEIKMLTPIIFENQSDSACLDNVVELLTLCGRSLPHVMMMLIPEAWDKNELMDPVKKAFYEFHATIMEPWDGPASISFTNGKIIGATLDRNGLRPARYTITKDDRVILASETGVLPIDPLNIKENGRLQPGKIFVVDLEKGQIISDKALKETICSQQPYQEWLQTYKIKLDKLPQPRILFTELGESQILKYQKAFGYSKEDIEEILIPMAIDAKEPIGSMGSDTPLAVLSAQPQHLSHYFKQLFAQVTNPPIDPIREKLVMSLVSFVGGMSNLLTENPDDCKSVALPHPILTNYELEKIRSIDLNQFQAKTLQTYFKGDEQPGSLKAGLDRLCRYAVDAVQDNFEIIILTDRAIDSEHVSIPSLLACSAVHQHLIKKGLRGKVGIIVECGDAWEVHHFATLIGFGATAINPYLALSTITNLKNQQKIHTNHTVDELIKNYITAINDGLLKVFSKMGISTLQSYQGAQIFEIIGLNKNVVDNYFSKCTSRIEGIGLDEIAKEAIIKHNYAFKALDNQFKELNLGGVYQWKRMGEFHLFNPQTIHLLQYSTKMNDYSLFKKFSNLINEQNEKACTLRSLLDFNKNRQSISIDEVEPAENMYKRFATGAMSFGSISWEAHTTLAIAMNRLGAKSNTGEGGEDEIRYELLANGDSMRSAIKQVASARFGVTSNYLTQADELQIKMAQGAKPGEGGQLPGHKVDDWIGKTRHAIPGVGLISPPPHHDIYSIEDLAQLIFDLKNANTSARINVKLVSKAGVGTIAAGVVKAKADVVLIAGHDGGTGASPLSSIKHAGLPWELGLAETHQNLVKNNLRSRVIVQTDGQLRTGRDIAIATLLGAEEWGIATAALVVEGCILMRKCHLNTCPVGIATQDPDLRKRYTGNADYVVNYIKFITQELREIMAELGFKTINEMVGQTDVLTQHNNLKNWKTSNIDLSAILYRNKNVELDTLYNSIPQTNDTLQVLDRKLVEAALPALEKGEKVHKLFNINNTDRAVGTMLSHYISKKYKAEGLAENTLHFKFTGIAGQSFGAFSTRGLTIELEGGANDYVGKGMCGANIIIYPNKLATFNTQQNSIIGNVAFFGATAGNAYISGMAGERFAVRNSGATIVVEGVGDHGCEYMTGGTVLILGEIGRNFAAGMSGGIAYIFKPANEIESLCNLTMIDLDPITTKDKEIIQTLLNQHYTNTKSNIAQNLIKNLDIAIQTCTKIFPKEYKKILNQSDKLK